MKLSENAKLNTVILQVSATDADIDRNGQVVYSLMNSKDTFSLGKGSNSQSISLDIIMINSSSFSKNFLTILVVQWGTLSTGLLEVIAENVFIQFASARVKPNKH